MCKPTKNLRLCTCIKQDGKLLNKDTWTLVKSQGEQVMVGETKMNYGNVVPIQNELLNQLNKRNTFDFEYQPKEGDKLSISWNDDNQYSFMFRNLKWVFD